MFSQEIVEYCTTVHTPLLSKEKDFILLFANSLKNHMVVRLPSHGTRVSAAAVSRATITTPSAR